MKIEEQQFSDIDISVLDTSENDEDGSLDLTVYGTKMIIHSIEVSSDDDESFYADFTFKENLNPEIKSEEADYDEINQSFDYDADGQLYIPQKFKGLDIKHAFQWEECLDFTQSDGLLVVELYCTVFGASDVMYPYIDEILHKQQNDKIKFVRLNVKKMSDIEEIKQVIVNYDKYYQSPLPTYIFIKNKAQIYRLKGTKPTEFGELIEKYSHDKTVEMKEKEIPIKYTSILQSKSINLPKVSSLSKQKKESNPIKEENIKNLIKNSAFDDVHIYATKLFKRNKNINIISSEPLK